MIPKECKRLAEVDFPIAVVSRHAVREKSIRHGHPSTLHLWWARRPLAACRAMLMALLLPDPCDPACPEEFKRNARQLLPQVTGALERSDTALRKKLLEFIGSFANWDNSASPTYLQVARGLVRAAYPDEPPLVVDPFAGGGSIPLEALRVGCEAFASDLNPVACLILKVMLEDIPRHGPALAEELRRVGAQIKEAAQKELAEFYPPDPDGAIPIAYLWARTVRCETPNCGAEIPLVRSFWLCKKANRRRALRYKVISATGFQPVSASASESASATGFQPVPASESASATGFQPVAVGFQPVNPWKAPDLSIARRNLPHLETSAATYFVTFRCRKGMQMPPEAMALVLAAIRHWDGKRIALDAAVVMPDHAHAMFRITDGSKLGAVLHSIKSFSANQINKLLNRTGAFWLDENFDHIVRHAAEWEDKFDYIRQNPVKKGLAESPAHYLFLYPQSHRQDACVTIEFEIFEPATDRDVRPGTVSRAKATCPCCNLTLPPERVRAQLAAQRGGADVIFDAQGRRTGGARLLAVVTLRPGEQGRYYRLSTDNDHSAIWKAQGRLMEILDQWERANRSGLGPVPDEPVDQWHHDVNRMPMYGMPRWGDLFTARQKLAMITLARLTHDWRAAHSSGAREGLAIVGNRCADYNSAICRWVPRGEYIGNTFTRQALPMTWDFCEIGLFNANATGGYGGAVDWVARVVEAWPGSRPGQAQLADAARHPLPDDTASIWFTDPPYYDAIDYAHCSDFFIVWLKRTLPEHSLFHDLLDRGNPLAPKTWEIVVDSTTTKGHGERTPKFYETRMALAFAQGRRTLRDDGVGSVVFAHKTTEGWEALLSGLIAGGWTITASWPVATEMTTRLRARESAALATSVHLVCRPRPGYQVGQASSLSDRQDAGPTGDWAEVLRELPRRVGDWMERLQGEGIRGADLVFACIGPALEIFSRYSKVETPEGREVKLPEFLEKVWEVVGRTALEQVLGTAEARARNSAAGVLEEDARLTALFLWTLQTTNHQQPDAPVDREDDEPEEEADEEQEDTRKKPGFSLIYDVVRRFAQPLGIHLEDWENRIIETKKGVVRLLPIRERAQQLFGEGGADLAADRIERGPRGAIQLDLVFEELAAAPEIRPPGRRPRAAVADEALRTRREATTLDRVHAAMLLQASGRSNALRALVKAEVERSPDFLRLANALSALYPEGAEEKRLVQAMVHAAPR